MLAGEGRQPTPAALRLAPLLLTSLLLAAPTACEAPAPTSAAELVRGGTWTTDNPGLVQVQAGHLYAVRPGQTWVRAEWFGLTAAAEVRIGPPRFAQAPTVRFVIESGAHLPGRCCGPC